MTYTIAVCTVKNSRRWTKKLSDTCRVSFQNKFENLVHLVAFIIRIYSHVIWCVSLINYVIFNFIINLELNLFFNV